MNAPQALALANKRIDELQTLANAQALLINEKNDEIASLRQRVHDLEASLHQCQSRDYADDLVSDSEAGAIGEVSA